jgi:FkbM family methyltransferase
MEPEAVCKARQPSMEFEHRTEELLRLLLPKVDPDRLGTCIEIGVGTYHWYCDLFAGAGYRSVAIEPIPAEPFIQRLRQGNIIFHEGVVAEHDGNVTVFLGKDGDTNLSSIRHDWWAATEHTKTVASMTLATIMRLSGIDRLTCLKVDAEGSESRILKQLLNFPQRLLPSLVVFEFGAAIWSNGKWLDHFDSDTMECLRILSSCGYGSMRTIDVFSEERSGNLQRDLNPEIYFGRDSQAGNAIAQVATEPRDAGVVS